ncbi:MAG: N-acetyltransferase [Nitrosomonadales bacterium]|nr:N-acetyltransferase [Nitrosomonadales bacterium]
MKSPTLKIIADLADISAAEWDALAGGNPFVSHAYLHALQQSGCTTAQSGWRAQFLTLWQDERLVGGMPLYLKDNSFGEHVFDFAWADAYRQHGLRYYPKLVCGVPFTPVGGVRLLAATAEVRVKLLRAALQYAKEGRLYSEDTTLITSALSLQESEGGISSLHCLFMSEADAQAARAEGMMLRQDVQFHWQNRGYKNFEDFLAALSRDKRKRIKQERRRVQEAGIRLECVTGDVATREQWKFFASCYAHTRQTHHSPPALNEDFFQRIGAAMPQHTLLVIASRAGKMIASALNIVTNEVLYGRSWGAFEFHSGLHFEACYYQAIEFCIAHGIKTFEGGAGGEHKLARGFLPVTTRSAHWLAHPQFARAVEDYLQRESDALSGYVGELNERSPFKGEYHDLRVAANKNG